MNIKIENISKVYKNNVRGLNDINLEIGEGIFGLLGQNGAGKTTLMRILTTLLTPTSGKVMICGIPIEKNNYDEIIQMIGYLPQELGLYPNLTVRESLDYMGGLSGLSSEIRKERISNLLELTGLAEHQKKKNKQLSGGMKRRVGLVQAMLTHPKVLIVDEPTAGVDPEERIKIRSLLADFGKTRTILFSTHTIEDIAATCHDLCVLNKGEVKYNGSVDTMLDMVQGHSYSCTLENENELMALQNEYFVTGKVYNLNKINVRFISKKEPTINCKPVEPNLEDAYIYINHI